MDPELEEAGENLGDNDPQGMSDQSDQEDTRHVLGQSFRMDQGFRIMDGGLQYPISAFNDTS